MRTTSPSLGRNFAAHARETAGAALETGDAHDVVERHPQREEARRLAGQRMAVRRRRIGDALGGQRPAHAARGRDRRSARSWNSTMRARPSATRSRAARRRNGRRRPVARSIAAGSPLAVVDVDRHRAPAAGAAGAAPHPRRARSRAGSPRRRGPRRGSTSSNDSRRNGSTPLPAIAPNITALTIVPASRAAASMSKVTRRRLCAARDVEQRGPSRSGRRPAPSSRRSSACGWSTRRASCGRGSPCRCLHDAHRFEQLGRDDEVDAARHRQQAQHRRASAERGARLRKDLDVVGRRARCAARRRESTCSAPDSRRPSPSRPAIRRARRRPRRRARR